MKIKTFQLLIIVILFISLTSCHEEQPPKLEIIESSYNILGDTIYETKVYTFETNVIGPTILIVGGIHGDEIAGFEAAIKMLSYEFTYGKIVIIPKAHILATQLAKRYPGQETNGFYNNVKYSDLNRLFPGKVDGNATEKIAYAIIQVIEEIVPDYILDLHESRRNYIDGYIGNSVIYGNTKSSIFALNLVEQFNQENISSNNVPFRVDNSPPEGSFNYYCSNNYDTVMLTLETDRRLAIEERIDQQMLLMKIFLSQIKDI